MSEDTSAAQAASYDRDSPLYPYKSHGQWLKAFYGLVGSCILLLFNGVPAFLEEPFNVRKFVSAYVGVCQPPKASLISANKVTDPRVYFTCRWVETPQTWPSSLALGAGTLQRLEQYSAGGEREAPRSARYAGLGFDVGKFGIVWALAVGMDKMISYSISCFYLSQL